jgi:hypothetical protein
MEYISLIASYSVNSGEPANSNVRVGANSLGIYPGTGNKNWSHANLPPSTWKISAEKSGRAKRVQPGQSQPTWFNQTTKKMYTHGGSSDLVLLKESQMAISLILPQFLLIAFFLFSGLCASSMSWLDLDIALVQRLSVIGRIGLHGVRVYHY